MGVFTYYLFHFILTLLYDANSMKKTTYIYFKEKHISLIKNWYDDNI